MSLDCCSSRHDCHCWCQIHRRGCELEDDIAMLVAGQERHRRRPWPYVFVRWGAGVSWGVRKREKWRVVLSRQNLDELSFVLFVNTMSVYQVVWFKIRVSTYVNLFSWHTSSWSCTRQCLVNSFPLSIRLDTIKIGVKHGHIPPPHCWIYYIQFFV